MANVRIARMLRLLTTLRARTCRNARVLGRELSVSERTIYRDLAALSEAGVPVHFDEDGSGYRIRGDFFLPPVQLTLGEAMALSVLGSQMARQGQPPFLQEAWQAVTKVRSQLPAAVLEEIEASDGRVCVQSARVSPQTGCEPHFETLRKAIARRRKVRCVYDGGRRDGPFLFRPYSLFFAQRAWYVIGLNERRGAERSLKLNRLRGVTATDRPYMIPDDWCLEHSLGNAWRMIRGKQRYEICVRFDGEFGRNVADTLWHPTQRITWQPDGSCLFECEVDGLDEIVWWVLGYGPHAVVLRPTELSEKMRQLGRDLVRVYEVSPSQRNRRAKRLPSIAV